MMPKGRLEPPRVFPLYGLFHTFGTQLANAGADTFATITYPEEVLASFILIVIYMGRQI